VTLFASGRARLVQHGFDDPDADARRWAAVLAETERRRGVWYRVGDTGDAGRGSRMSHSLVASRAGRLLVAAALDKPAEDSAPRVDRGVQVVRWAGDPSVGLRALLAIGDVGGLVAGELARLDTTIEHPAGWHSPATGGPSEQFTVDADALDGPVIGCYSRDSGALLLTPAAVPLLPATTLRWRWRMEELPSEAREDALATHDYLSIAVEFDNGRDLTYYWSAALPVGTGYHCPVPGWEDRETHVVVRSGRAGLGQWCDEARDVHADYARYIGDPPGSIVRIWLLAVTFFQRGAGRGDYGRIEIENEVAHVRVN
jgi:hypothetical protein